MVRLHEVIQIVADLREREELELARRIAAEYMDRLDSGELRFNHLSLTASLGHTVQVMDLLEEYLDTDRWFSTWFLSRIPELNSIEDLPRFRRILQASEEKEAQYWQDEVMGPVVQFPASGKPPYPLLVAIHGNGFNPRHSASGWAFAAESGWLVFHPVARRLAGYGLHWWDTHEDSRETIEVQAEENLKGFPIDPDRVVLGGFSKGGEVAMVLALLGWRGAKGFITVGAGGYYHMEPERWGALLASPPDGLHGVAMYSPYDLGRSGGVNQTLPMMRAAGIEIREEVYPAEGHVFPEDFEQRFEEAVEFILGTT